MKNGNRKIAYAMVMALSLTATPKASAMVLVVDFLNAKINKNGNKKLEEIKKQLADQEKGTVNYYTNNIATSTSSINNLTTNIDNTTTNIDASTTKIDKSTTNIDNTTQNIDSSTTNISNLAVKNTQVNTSIKVVINNKGTGEEIIPIPEPVQGFFAAIKNGQSDDDYSAKYKSADDYERNAGMEGDPLPAGYEGSRAQKAANDAWVKSIKAHQEGLEIEAKAVAEFREMNKEVEGHGKQMQIANALTQMQINQMIQMRSMLMVSDAAKLTQAQAAADKEARMLAASNRLRAGLEQATTGMRREAVDLRDIY